MQCMIFTALCIGQAQARRAARNRCHAHILCASVLLIIPFDRMSLTLCRCGACATFGLLVTDAGVYGQGAPYAGHL